MELTVLKIFFGVLALLLYLPINVIFAVFVDYIFCRIARILVLVGRYVRLGREKLQLISKRNYLSEKISERRDKFVYNFSGVWLLIFYLALLVVVICICFYYLRETNELFAAIQLATLSFIPLLLLSIHVCRSKFLTEILDCHICGWIRWVLLITWLWAAHTDASDNLSSQFGAASLHLTSAYGAATFMSAIAFMSIPCAVMVLVVEVLLFTSWMALSIGKSRLPTYKNYVAISTMFIGLIVLIICNQAQKIIGLEDTRSVLTGYFAWQFDMLNADVCIDTKYANNSPRKIVYMDPAQKMAFLFMYPLHDDKYLGENKINPKFLIINKIHKNTVKRLQPINLGVVECKYSAPSV